MKTIFKILLLTILFSFSSCDEDAEDAYASESSASATDINGTWKVTASNFVIRISGASSSNFGTATIISVGTALPSGANGGNPLKEIDYQQGLYWNAYNYTYYPDGTWVQTSAVALAMSEDKSQFKIGSAVYKRQ
jgi:hypothetical protein